MQVKKRIFAGSVCDQIVYEKPDDDGTKDISIKNPKPRFKTQEEYEAFKLQQAKRWHALLINANFGPSSWFLTLTFDDANEVYEFDDARRIRDNYYRCLRYAYPNAKIIIYMGRGKNTARIHFHALVDGIPEDFLMKKWKYGEIRQCRKLREHNIDHVTKKDHGRDYTNVANYCFDHWTPEQGHGRHYKKSNNFAQPESEEPTACQVKYSAEHPPRAPKGYIYTGDAYITQYGYMRFRYIIDPNQRPRSDTETRQLNNMQRSERR